MNNTEILLTNVLSNVVNETSFTGARFAGLTYTSSESGKVARYTLILGVNLTNAYKDDLNTLTNLRDTLTGVELVACDEMIASINNSLTNGIGNNDDYTLKGYYRPISENGEVNFHKDEKGVVNLYLRGYLRSETVIKEGVYKTVKSSEKTLAKKKLEKGLKKGQIRTFKINVNNIKSIRMNGTTIEIE